MVQEFYRLGVLLGAGVQLWWFTLSLAAIACLATSQAASDSKTCPVEMGVGTPGISIIKIWAISIVQFPQASDVGYRSPHQDLVACSDSSSFDR
jgi:hypothetical protein